jgi:hypothetical protein
MFATWPDLEPAPGFFAPNWLAFYERVFSELPAGTKVIIDVVDTPRWETGSSNEHSPPANPGDYAAFLGELAHRWARRVSAYEIWNEEDAPSWWTGAPDPAAYARLLEATYPVLKAAEPNATVVLGGLTGTDYEFLEGVHQAGARGSFDAVGVHTDTACNVLSPYDFLRGRDNRMIPDSFLAYREVHATMLANGDDKPIRMTETSWRTTSAVCSEGVFAGRKPEGVTPAQQTRFLRQAYHCLARDPYVQVALWVSAQRRTSDRLGTRGGQRLTQAFVLRNALLRARRRSPPEPCGVLSGPRIRVFAPANRVTYSGPLRIHVLARASDGVFRITLKVDGKLIRNYDAPTYPSTLTGLLEWQGANRISYGRHTLTFIAYDKERNVSQRSITIYHRRAPYRGPAGKRGRPAGASR